jgi:hypothetical protein
MPNVQAGYDMLINARSPSRLCTISSPEQTHQQKPCMILYVCLYVVSAISLHLLVEMRASWTELGKHGGLVSVYPARKYII